MARAAPSPPSSPSAQLAHDWLSPAAAGLCLCRFRGRLSRLQHRRAPAPGVRYLAPDLLRTPAQNRCRGAVARPSALCRWTLVANKEAPCTRLRGSVGTTESDHFSAVSLVGLDDTKRARHLGSLNASHQAWASWGRDVGAEIEQDVNSRQCRDEHIQASFRRLDLIS
ncbi:hypothetical protein B0T16DRAFT_388090 [Cercophora newfieldiana]|uniref:Uncharacterized protein n=1 Tax=Cercophora newfieldiana TaxID=92897 RepID=A0AA39YJ35_9PEZI|nr:hypothetical protein B0T16DRAFT_388090 [Cercophora newfieldiana]